jgi:hypothetical protein
MEDEIYYYYYYYYYKGSRCLPIILLDLTTGLGLDWPCDAQIRDAIVETHLSTIASQG